MLKSPLNIYGGKARLVKYILPLIYAADPVRYVEPCAGGAQMTFALPKHRKEVINDINGNIVAFFRVLKTKQPEFIRKVVGTPYSRSEFQRAKEIFFSPHDYSDIDRAWAAWAGCTMGFAHSPQSFGFDHNGEREVNLKNKRDRIEREAGVFAQRLETVTIENDDLQKIIKRYDTPDTLFFIDPPYFNSDMGFYSGYTEEKFKSLLEQLSGIKGKFVLTSYPSELLGKYTKKNKWRQRGIVLKVAANNTANSKHKQKTEVITWNFDESAGALSGLDGSPHPAFLIARILELIITYR
ncbi:MAG: DNA adenine methylase [Bacteroidota bacterium]